MTPAELRVAEARQYLGVKWRHRGRKPWSLDCIGLVIRAVAAGGLQMVDRQNYGREPWNDGLRQEMRAQLGDPVEDWQPGDIALISWDQGSEPSHVGVIGDYPDGLSLIHAYSLVSVCEHRIDEDWRKRIIEVYRP